MGDDDDDEGEAEKVDIVVNGKSDNRSKQSRRPNNEEDNPCATAVVVNMSWATRSLDFIVVTDELWKQSTSSARGVEPC